MLSRLIAKNIGDVFLDTVYIHDCPVGNPIKSIIPITTDSHTWLTYKLNSSILSLVKTMNDI